jgi:sulfite exporter TauE/SafE
LLAYAAAGALVAAGSSALFEVVRGSAWLRPLWTLLQVAGLMLGLWLLISGRPPFWSLGPGPAQWLPVQGPGRQASSPKRRPMLAFGLGLAWVGWPCGLLYAALAVATLASSPASGALVMGAFALTSATGLLALPLWLGRLALAERGEKVAALAIRGAGALLVAAGVWTLSQTMRGGVAVPWCLPG